MTFLSKTCLPKFYIVYISVSNIVLNMYTFAEFLPSFFLLHAFTCHISPKSILGSTFLFCKTCFFTARVANGVVKSFKVLQFMVCFKSDKHHHFPIADLKLRNISYNEVVRAPRGETVWLPISSVQRLRKVFLSWHSM